MPPCTDRPDRWDLEVDVRHVRFVARPSGTAKGGCSAKGPDMGSWEVASGEMDMGDRGSPTSASPETDKGRGASETGDVRFGGDGGEGGAAGRFGGGSGGHDAGACFHSDSCTPLCSPGAVPVPGGSTVRSSSPRLSVVLLQGVGMDMRGGPSRDRYGLGLRGQSGSVSISCSSAGYRPSASDAIGEGAREAGCCGAGLLSRCDSTCEERGGDLRANHPHPWCKG